MRKVVLPVVLVLVSLMFWTTGCTDRKPVVDSTQVDSLVIDTGAVDTLDRLISEQQMPKAADELFDDFIFNFAANRKLQMNRIIFPLKKSLESGVVYVGRKAWKMEHFFMDQGFYTLILDNNRQLKALKDTTINNVVVEKINLNAERVNQYNFQRIKGKWMLTSVATNPLEKNVNASFLLFYKHFSKDSVFQIKSLNNPVMFTGPDPDDDFNMVSGEIVPETWPAFSPELPSGTIYNIHYGQKSTNSNRKIFMMRGISNGMEMKLIFRRIDGNWKLTEFAE